MVERQGRAVLPFAVEGADFYFCGPSSLHKGILMDLEARGVRPGRVRFEMFEFR